MPTRKTLKQVIDEVYAVSGGRTQLLSNDYTNNRQKLLFLCQCGNMFERDAEHVINRKAFLCAKCARKELADLRRKNFNCVLEEIAVAGCEYVSGEYENESSMLTCRCRCGELFSRDLKHISRGQNTCMTCSMKRVADSKRKYDQDSARETLRSYGYEMIGLFVDAAKPVLSICKNGHECNIVLSQLRCGRSGCDRCAKEQRKGTGSHFYIDGRATMQDSLRASLEQWKREIAERYSYACPITGRTGMDCDVHHIKPLREIFADVAARHGLSVQLKSTINEFPSYDIFDQMRRETVEAHTLDTGIFVSTGIHRLFHKVYGTTKETQKDFDEFLCQYFNTSLDEIWFKHPVF